MHSCLAEFPYFMKGIQRGIERILGGEIAANPVPWQAILYKNGHLKCGGVIIDQTTILSAAHCFYENDTKGIWQSDTALYKYKVSVGSKFREVPNDMRFELTKIVLHPQFDRYHLNEGHDIAILKLPWKYRITYGLDIAPICLPTKNFQDVLEDCDLFAPQSPQCSHYMKMSCYISGFGQIEQCNLFHTLAEVSN